MSRVVTYGRKFRIHCVKLYATTGSLLETRKAILLEIKQNKWPYSNAPTASTIMHWSNKYVIDMEEDGEQDPVKKTDIDTLNIVLSVQTKIRKALRHLSFESIRDCIYALNTVTGIRKSIEKSYKNPRELVKDSRILEKKLRKLQKGSAVVKKELREKILNFEEAAEALRRSKRGRSIAQAIETRTETNVRKEILG